LTQATARSRIFAGTWLAYAGFYFCRKNFSVAIPLLKGELGFTVDQLAWVLVLYNSFYMLGQFGNGLLSRRIGPRMLVTFGAVTIVLMNIAMGLSSMIGLFMIVACLHGYAQATGWPGTCQIMANWFPKEERGVVMAWWSTNYVLGGFLATLFATWCITNDWLFPALGWRRGFFFPSIVLILVALAFFLLVRSKSEKSESEELVIEPGRSEARADLKVLLRMPALWVSGSMYFFLKLTRYALLFWLPLYLTESLHYSTKDAGNTSAYFELFGIGGTLAAGYLSDHLFKSKRYPVSALMLFGLAGACLLQPYFASLGIGGMIASIALIGFMTYGPDSLMSGAAAMDLGNERTAATAVGIVNGMGSAGQLISPLVVAWISQQYGWPRLFQFFVVCAVVGGVLLLTQVRSQSRDAR
jgi:sugar phosphate permease